MMLKKFNDFLDEKNVTSITESEDKKDKKWYTSVTLLYSMNVDPWSKDSIYFIKEEEQKKRITAIAKMIKDAVSDCEEEVYKNKRVDRLLKKSLLCNNTCISVKSTLCLFDEDVEDIENLKKTNNYTKDLYDSIKSIVKSEPVIKGVSIGISSYSLDKENPDKEVWYFFNGEKMEWEVGEKEVEPKDRSIDEEDAINLKSIEEIIK